MRKVWAVMRRDLIKLSRTPFLIFASLLMPLLYLVILGNSFEGQLKHLPLAVVNEDNGFYGLRVMEEMQALAAGPRMIVVSYMNDPARAIGQVRDGRFKAALIIPPRFSHDIAEGRIGELGLFTDNVDSVSAGALESAITEATSAIRNTFVTAREPKLNQIVLRSSNLFVTVDYDRSLIPGVIVMALFMGSMTSGVFNWIMDRFSGITEAYLVTPLSPWHITGGILAASILATTCEAIIVMLAGLAITGGAITGGPRAIALLCGVIALSGTGILAMMFALFSHAGNPRMIGAPAGFLNVILFFPSGALYPVESLPPWLRAFTRWNPETHAVSAIKSLMFKGANTVAIAGDVKFLAVFSVLMLLLAGATMRRTL